MSIDAGRAVEIEEAFLAGARANLDQARRERLPGSAWSWTERSEEQRVRQLMIEAGHSDRETLRALPKNRTRMLTGTRRRWLVRRRRSSVAMASVISPIEAYLKPGVQPAPVGLARLVEHVKSLTGEADVPHLVGVCSTTGFTQDAKASGLELPNVTLVLVEPRSDGGWHVVGVSPDATEADAKLFDPEAITRKLARVREEIRSRSVELLGGGLSASAMAARLGLPADLVTTVFEQAVREQPDLMVSRRGNDALLFRGAVAVENPDMSMMDHLRQLFGQGDETKKINALSERRVRLVQRRDRIYEDLAALEQREAVLMQQGRETASPSAKRRVASQVKQLRDDMERLNASARVLGQQVEIISTHIHNLTLIQQGQAARLPTTEQITQDAVRAEEMLEQLGADAELAGSLSTGAEGIAASEEELAILRELEGTPPAGEGIARKSPAAGEARDEAPAPEKRPERREPEAG